MKKISDTKILLIGLGLSIVLHGLVFLVLANIKSPEKPKKKEKIVYINILKPEKKKNAVPKPKKKIPIGQHKKKVIKPAPKPKSKPVKHKPKPVKPKPIKHKPKPIKPKPRPKPVKKPKPQPKPVEKPQPQPKPPKKETVQPVEQQPKTETKGTTEQNKNVSQNQNFNLSSLKGKELIYQHGEEKKEKKKTDEDIQAYIRALEEYLNELARRKDLYPPMAKRLRIEGSLVVRFTIKADGSVDENSIKIVESSNYSVLDKGAIKIIKKYVPLFAKKYGKKPPKGDLTVELPVTFEIIGW